MKNVPIARLISLRLGLVQHGAGIYLGDSGVYIAEVSRKGLGIVLTKACYEPFPPSLDDVSPSERLSLVKQTVRKCIERAKVKAKYIFSSPSPTQVVMRYFQIPLVPKKDWYEAIRFEGSRYVPFRLDELVFGFHAKPFREKDVLEVSFNAIRIDTLREHLRLIEESGFKLWDTEAPFHSMARALREQIKKVKDAALLLNFSESGTVSLSILKDGFFYVCRDFFIPPGVDQVQKFFTELDSSLDYFKKHAEDVPVGQVFLAGNYNLPVWKKALETFFSGNVPVEVASFPSTEDIPPEDASQFLIPIGLALRSIGVGAAADDISFLMTGAVAEERIAPRKWTGFVTLASLLLGVGFYFGFFLPQKHQLETKLVSAQSRLAQFSAASPELVNQSASALEGRLGDIQAKTKIIELFQGSRSFLGQKLSVLSETVPSSIWFYALSYQEGVAEGGNLVGGKRTLLLDGYIYYREIPEEELRRINQYVAELRGDLAFMAGFSSLKLEGVERISIAGRSFTKFRIVCSH